MTEPVYKFVKGEGWVVSQDPECLTIYTYHSNKKWVFEWRDPKPGEHYLALYGGASEDYVKDVARIVTENRFKPEGYFLCTTEDDFKNFGRQHTVVYREA